MTDIQKQYAAIPHELKCLPNWVCFTFEPNPDGGKARKVPYQVDGTKASHSDPATWNTYPNCIAAVERGKFDTIGFAFANTPYMGFDYDNCLDTETGILKSEAQEIVDRLCSYTEESVSGTGIHILMKGSLPEGRRKSSPVLPDTEMYDTDRFFVTTGEHWPGTPNSIEERTAVVAELHRELFPPEPKRAPSAPMSTNPMTDEEIIQKALASKSDKFARLWSGNWQGSYPSQSEADLALCSSLAWWTGNDDERIDRLFRRSSLYRKKWDTAYYRNKTIEHAIAGTHTSYRCEERAYLDRTQTTHNAPSATPRTLTVPGKAKATDALDSEADEMLKMLDSQTLPTYALQKTTYLIEPEIPKGALILVTGKPNSGKSTVVFKWCVDMAKAGNEILYLDRDNGLNGAREKVNRFGAENFPHIRYWGLWNTDSTGEPCEPPFPDSKLLRRMVKKMNNPVIVFDTLATFSGCDENDNKQIGGIFKHLRALTNLGATVLVIHHTTKNGESNYRGASSMEGAVDAGIKITANIVEGLINTIEVNTFKSRLGDGKPIMYRMVNDLPERVTSTATEFLMGLVERNSGLTKEKFEDVGRKANYKRAYVREFIENGLTAGVLTYSKEHGLNLKNRTQTASKPPTSFLLFEEDAA